MKPTLHAYSTPQIEYDIKEPASAEQAKLYNSFANQVIHTKVSSNVKKQKKLLHQYAIPMKNNTFYSYNSHRGAAAGRYQSTSSAAAGGAAAATAEAHIDSLVQEERGGGPLGSGLGQQQVQMSTQSVKSIQDRMNDIVSGRYSIKSSVLKQPPNRK